MIAHQADKTALVERYTLPALLDAITTIVKQTGNESTLPKRTLSSGAPHSASGELNLSPFPSTAREESEEHREDSEGRTLSSVLGALTVLASEPSLCRVLVPRLLQIAESHWAGTSFLTMVTCE
jgi:hypothetical protein